MVRLALWILPFRTLQRIQQHLGERRPSGRPSRHTAREIATAIGAAARYIPRATCLTRALAAQFLLKANGHAAILHIGVARPEVGAFQAHAWVESGGTVLLGGSEAALYTRLGLFS